MKKYLCLAAGLSACVCALAQQKVDAVETVARFADLGSQGGVAADETYYDNTVSETGFIVYATLRPHRVLDDIFFDPGPGGGQTNVFTNQHTISWHNSVVADFDYYVVFYDDLDWSADPVNSTLIDGYFVQVRGQAAGAWYAIVDLSGIGGVTLPDDTFAVDFVYYEPDSTSVLDSNATPIFPQTNSGPVVGFSDDIMAWDTDLNGTYSPTELYWFGGPPNIANLFFGMQVVGGSCNPCDADCNGSVNGQDIQPFIDVLNGGAGCGPCTGDADGNGTVNGQDIDDFITCLTP